MPATSSGLFRSAKVGSGTVWFWRSAPQLSEGDLLLLPPGGIRDRLCEVNQRRVEEESLFADWVPDLKPVTLGAEMLQGDRRHHILQLLSRTNGTASALFCRITLFGGLLDVHAQLVPSNAADGLPLGEVTERIDF